MIMIMIIIIIIINIIISVQSLRAFRLAKIRSYEDWMIGGLEEWKSLGGLEDGKDCNIGRPCLAMFLGSERDGKSTKLARNRLRGATIV